MMNLGSRLIVFSLVLLLTGIKVVANEVLIISGTYLGMNLYVQNPILPDNKFSTEEVFVNDRLVLKNPMTSAFTVDLSHLQVNQPVEIRIVHKERFQPRVINPHVLHQNVIISETRTVPDKEVFRWVNLDDRLLRWLSHGADKGGMYQVQRAEKEDWAEIGTIPADSLSGDTIYKLPVNHEQGDNSYRIRYTDPNGFVTYSEPIGYRLK